MVISKRALLMLVYLEIKRFKMETSVIVLGIILPAIIGLILYIRLYLEYRKNKKLEQIGSKE